ncbi:MAG: transposase [Nitrospirales bacterium]|nr:transposase [Nitrospirales bacterium]
MDYRVYQKDTDGKTKSDLFREMLKKAKKIGCSPLYVLMDAWYSGVETLKMITGEGEWQFICNVRGNRQVSMLRGFDISISDLELAKRRVRQVWLKGYGPVLVGKLVSKDGDITYLVSSDLSASCKELKKHWKKRWKIEEFHRGLKQTTGIEKCYSTKAVSQKTHIFAAVTAFVKMEWIRLQKGISWYEQKAMIGRYAVFRYLKANA